MRKVTVFPSAVTLNSFQGPSGQQACQSEKWMLKQVQHDGLPGAVWQDELSHDGDRYA